MALSRVEQQGSMTRTFDEKGKMIARMSNSGELCGVGSDFFVLQQGNVLKTFDEKCKIIKTMSNGNKILSVAGQTITIKNGNSNGQMFYDKNLKKTGSRS